MFYITKLINEDAMQKNKKIIIAVVSVVALIAGVLLALPIRLKVEREIVVGSGGQGKTMGGGLYIDETNSYFGINVVDPLTALQVGGSGSISANFEVGGYASVSQTRGSGLTDCDVAATSKLLWDVTTGKFSCGTDQTSAGANESETVVVASQDTANATTTLAGATGLTFTADANSTYIIEVFLLWDSSVATVGIKLSASATNTPTKTAGAFITDATTGTPDSSTYNANDVVVTTSASPFTTSNVGKLNAILITAGSSSVWQIRFAAETTGTITIKAGSTIRYRKVL